MHNSFSIGRVKDIEIKIHYSWFLIFFLVVWSLAEFSFPVQYPGWTKSIYWLSASIAAFFLFLSVLFHELFHSLVGKRSQIIVKSITLFIFGGVAEMISEPKRPVDEFKMAIAGPLASLFLAGLFGVVSCFEIGITGSAITGYLFLINGMLCIFNLIPAFPLDGGRVFRSILWAKYNDVDKATRLAVKVSRFCAFLLTLWGLKILILDNNFIAGLWVILISWFLMQAAGSSLKQMMIEEVLMRVNISKIMDRNFRKVHPKMLLKDLAEEFLDWKQGGFPVEQNNKLLGIVTLEDLRSVPRKKWPTVRIEQIMTSVDKLEVLKPTDTAYDAFLKITSSDVGRLPVVENGKVVGLITRNSILVLLAVKCEKCI